MILDENLENLIWNLNESHIQRSLNTYNNAYSNASDIFGKFESDSRLIIIRHNSLYCVFDLQSLKTYSFRLDPYDEDEPYFIHQNVTEILKVNDKLVWYNKNQINIINMKNGCLIKSINENKDIQKIEASADDKLVVLINDKNKKLKIYDLNGEMTNEYKINSENSNKCTSNETDSKLLFKLDKNNTFYILEVLF
jgi:hypothetical protein